MFAAWGNGNQSHRSYVCILLRGDLLRWFEPIDKKANETSEQWKSQEDPSKFYLHKIITWHIKTFIWYFTAVWQHLSLKIKNYSSTTLYLQMILLNCHIKSISQYLQMAYTVFDLIIILCKHSNSFIVHIIYRKGRQSLHYQHERSDKNPQDANFLQRSYL